MNTDLLLNNITNPSFLFFILGILAVKVKSDLEIPQGSSRFISLYLLFAIGFKGGQELAREEITNEIFMCMAAGLLLSLLVPLYTFFILKRKFSISDAGAIAAAYGSVSAVTFITASAFLEMQKLPLHGHMVAVMAFMESPAIVAGLLLISFFGGKRNISVKEVMRHSLTNASVFLIMGSLVIGYLADAKQAEGIKPFTNDIFKGFLAIFLLDMGIASGKRLGSITAYGIFPFLFAICIPAINGSLVAWLSSFWLDDLSNRFILSVLAASASYIAVPAAMKIAVPDANPGLYLPMSLAITFPFNITLGMPLYMGIVNVT